MKKSDTAFRTISEVAEWLDTPAHVLRFWESKFPQVKPVKRAGGRRYYRPKDMLLLGGIKQILHHDRTTIKAAQNLIKSKGVKHVMKLSRPLFNEEDQQDRPSDRVQAPVKADTKDPTPIQENVIEAAAVVEETSALETSALATETTDQVASADVPDSEPKLPSETTDDQPSLPLDDSPAPRQEAAVTEPKAEQSDPPMSDRLPRPERPVLSIRRKDASEFPAEEFKEVEALFYELKKLHNRMRRRIGA